jgi:hypothetical protein
MNFVKFILFFIVISGVESQIQFSGSILDTSRNLSSFPALILITHYRDSTLITWQRTDARLSFSFSSLPVDTYKVIISRKGFSDRIIFLIGSEKNKTFHMPNLILPPLSVDLQEVTIFAFREPVYYHGDTLVYVADSFKVRPDATIEDLLKKLPGIQVNAQGKIKHQGKEVNKVLLDGDEYFGQDYTMITRNMDAGQVENVKVFEEKNLQDPDEVLKVMNIELKESAKKGINGNLYGAGGNEKYYESSVLMNAFSAKQKLTLSAQANNTQGSVFENYYYTESDNGFFTATDEMGDAVDFNQNNGLPQHIKTSLNCQLNTGKHTKWNLQYAFRQNKLNAEENNNFFYQLPDTSYTLNELNKSLSVNESHAFRLRFFTHTDSFGKITADLKYSLKKNNFKNSRTENFLNEQNTLNRNTLTESEYNEMLHQFMPSFIYEKKFRKKFREFNLTASSDISQSGLNGLLQTQNFFFAVPSFSLSDFDQQKDSRKQHYAYNLHTYWQEPLSEKFFLTFQYGFSNKKNIRTNRALNKSGDSYSILDSAFSGEFINIIERHTPQTAISYKTDKWKITAELEWQYSFLRNEDRFRNLRFNYPFSAWQPKFRTQYRPNQNKNYSFIYSYNSRQPEPEQLITVPDNRNQNFQRVGNPELRPTLEHSFNFYHWFYTGLSRKYFFINLYHTYSPNAISFESGFDSLGRSITRPVNVRGNYTRMATISADIPLFRQLLSLGLNAGYNENLNINYVNQKSVKNLNRRYSGGLALSTELEFLSFYSGLEYSYYANQSDRFNDLNVPYSTLTTDASLRLRLFKQRLDWNTDASYSYFGNRPPGFNPTPLIINSGIKVKLFKSKKLYAEFTVHDLLNQNVDVQRNITQNYIHDTRSLVVRRYFLFGLRWKFIYPKPASNNENEDDNEE